MDIDKLTLTCKQLYDVRIIEQRREIEKLRKKIEGYVYLVITEEYFGGPVKCFWEESSANNYKKELEEQNLNVIIVKIKIT